MPDLHTVKLNNGIDLPVLGFGVYKSTSTVHTVKAALSAGYRHIDTAQYYQNEAEVGEAILTSGLPRGDVFVTTKTMGNGLTTEEYLHDLKNSIERIALGYVDLFLIHNPLGGPEKRKRLASGFATPLNVGSHFPQWKALEQLHAQGFTKSIGVSNYGVKHLEEMHDYATVKPVVNQIELHPWCQQKDIVEQCVKDNIVVEAYCPIARNKKSDDPVLLKIADKHGKQPTQILIKWSLQKGYVPLPKSDNPDRIKTNATVFDFTLDPEDLASLDGLDSDYHCTPNVTNAD